MNEKEVDRTPLRFFNTLTRQKEPLETLQPNQVRMYTCGPTVYDFAHIGNFRTYVFEDLLRRTLKLFGNQVTQVMNLTDVDDKTIRGAIKNGVDLDTFTEKYKKAFFHDLGALNIEPAEHYPAATDYIPQMVEMIQQLIEKGVAYEGGDNSVYFAINKFPHYGCLSHLHLDELKAGASERVAADEYEKDNVSDFVLWKSHDPERDGQIFWNSPWGPGRPGWHLECSVMAMRILGDTLDIHVGAVDNIFPHHENEIAQSEACSGKTFSKLWMHSEHLVVDNSKMSKSKGNFYTLRDLLKRGYSGPQVRYLLMSTHYRTKLNFTFQSLDAAKSALQRLNDFIIRLQGVTEAQSTGESDVAVRRAHEAFLQALADDLNISPALAALFDAVREINALIDKDALSQTDAERVLQWLKQVNSVLGVLDFNLRTQPAPEALVEALQRRTLARKERNWKLADELRSFIENEGYAVEDNAEGSTLKKL